jgi:hypothetical protein
VAAQQQVTTQRIWGAFNPTSNQIIGVQISGEGIYQNVPNALIAPTYAQARLATSAATQTIFVMGHNSVSDGAGGTFAFNAADTSSGCICIGSSAGTVLTVTSVVTGAVVVGQTLCSSVTGLPLATIASFGTGVGGVGTYNLSGTVNQPGPFTFLIDNNLTGIISVDGSRWVNTETSQPIFGLTAPSGNPALSITTPLYTFGNATDNPNYLFTGSGVVSLQPALNFATVDPAPQNGMYLQAANTIGISTASTQRMGISSAGVSVIGVPFTSRGITDTATATAITIGTGGNVAINAPTAGNNALSVTGVSNSNTAVITAGGTLGQAFGLEVIAGSNSSDYCFFCESQNGLTSFFKVRGDGAIQGLGPNAATLVDMTPDTGTFSGTFTGMTTSPTIACRWVRVGGLVILNLNTPNVQTTGTSNSTSFTMTGLPAAIQPVSNNNVMTTNWLIDNGANTPASIFVGAASGTITFYKGSSGSAASWTNAGLKGIAATTTIAYLLS